jgi:hypothetical protein
MYKLFTSFVHGFSTLTGTLNLFTSFPHESCCQVRRTTEQVKGPIGTWGDRITSRNTQETELIVSGPVVDAPDSYSGGFGF